MFEDIFEPIHEGTHWADDDLILSPGCRVEVLLTSARWLSARYIGCGSLPVVTFTWGRPSGQTGPPYVFPDNSALMILERGAAIRRIDAPVESPPPPWKVTAFDPISDFSYTPYSDLILGCHLAHVLYVGMSDRRPVYKTFLGGPWELKPIGTDMAVRLKIPMGYIILPSIHADAAGTPK